MQCNYAQMNGSLDWNGVRDFLAIVEAGSLSRAAVGQRVSQATLSRRLAAFERDLGVQLLIRGPRHLELTDAGQRILDSARRMSKDAIEVSNAALDSGRELVGTVRISTTEAFSSLWLAEQLHEFTALYPGICVELIADNQLSDLLGRDADIAIRLLQPTQQDLIARRVGTLRIGMFASRHYIERNGNPRKQSELGSHRVVAISGRRQFAADIETRLGDGNIVLRVRNIQVALVAIQAGIGIGPLYRFVGDDEVNLARVLEDEPEIEMDVWLTVLPDVNENARVRALYDYLASTFVRQKRRFA